MNFVNRKTVPCKYCGISTHMTSTKLCDGCWELERRVTDNPELARRILAEMEDNASRVS